MWAQTLETCNDPSDFAYCTCAVYSCGYSQPHRDWLTFERLRAGTAETDCSYGVGTWLYWGGYLDENPAFHTAIELDYLVSHGFAAIDANAGFVSMERNDVLLRSGHTALYIGDGMQAEALRDENHQAGYEGTTPGDNDGGETVVRPLTLDWDWVIRRTGKPVAPLPMEGNDMAFIFSCDANDHMWYCGGDRVIRIETKAQEDALKDAHMMACGRPLPQFHLPNGGALIDLLG